MTKRLWEFQFEKLQSFKLMNGHCNVPTNFQHDSQLASWVKTQRKVSWSLSKDQIDRLNSIGFTWKIRETHIRVDWEVRFQELVDYKRVHGHCNVPRDYKANPHLGTWIGLQRRTKQTMSEERRKRLNSIGFTWKFRKAYISVPWEVRFRQLVDYKRVHATKVLGRNTTKKEGDNG